MAWPVGRGWNGAPAKNGPERRQQKSPPDLRGNGAFLQGDSLELESQRPTQPQGRFTVRQLDNKAQETRVMEKQAKNNSQEEYGITEVKERAFHQGWVVDTFQL